MIVEERKLDKMGQRAQDTAELNFTDVRVPVANGLGEVNKGFHHLMHNLTSERLSIAIAAVAGARTTFEQTLHYAKDRKAFGQSIGSFQHNRLQLAEMTTELDIAERRCPDPDDLRRDHRDHEGSHGSGSGALTLRT